MNAAISITMDTHIRKIFSPEEIPSGICQSINDLTARPSMTPRTVKKQMLIKCPLADRFFFSFAILGYLLNCVYSCPLPLGTAQG